MRLHRFYINTPIGENKQLTTNNQQLIHQWRNVFRMASGDSVILFDGSGNDYVCEIITLDKKEAEVKIIEKKKGIIPDREVWLFFSLIKKDNAELILQKCTELGISHFVPVISERSSPAQTFSTEKLERARKILIEASEQCGRGDIPKLHEIIALDKALETYGGKIPLIALDSSGSEFNVVGRKLSVVGLLVGPEGGWSEKELQIFKQKNIPVYSLGKLTLRAETAAVVAVSLFLSI